MRARFRALLLSTAMLFAATSNASAAFDGDCFPDLAAAPAVSLVADIMPADTTHEMILRGTVGPIADASHAGAETSAGVAAADIVLPLPDDLGSEVAQALAAWSAPVAEADAAAAEASLAPTADEPQATGTLVATAVATEEPSESIEILTPTVE